MNILSDGKSDGIALSYVKDGNIYPVALEKEQVEMLDITIAMALQGKLSVVKSKQIGQVCDLRKVER